jgi:hypothetical protein
LNSAWLGHGKRKFIGEQLISPVPQGLLEPIYEHFPQLAPWPGTPAWPSSIAVTLLLFWIL